MPNLPERPHERRELVDAPPQFATQAAKSGACSEAVPSGIEVRRDGQNVPYLHFHPAISSADMRWSGIALEQYSTPACLIPRHEHLDHFVHVVRSGSCKYQVNTGGKTRKFVANPGTIFVLPRGTVDELIWNGPGLRIAVSIRPDLLLNALEESAAARRVPAAHPTDMCYRKGSNAPSNVSEIPGSASSTRDWTLAFKIPVILHEHFVGLSALARRSTKATCSHKPNGLFDLGRAKEIRHLSARVA
jgi:AraC-like ligand binding domain